MAIRDATEWKELLNYVALKLQETIYSQSCSRSSVIIVVVCLLLSNKTTTLETGVHVIVKVSGKALLRVGLVVAVSGDYLTMFICT